MHEYIIIIVTISVYNMGYTDKTDDYWLEVFSYTGA